MVLKIMKFRNYIFLNVEKRRFYVFGLNFIYLKLTSAFD